MRNSIRSRLTIIFIGLAVGPLLLVGLVLAWQSFTTQEQQALSAQREVAQRVSTQVTAFFEELENELRIASQVQGLQNLDRARQQEVLAELLSLQDAFEELVLLDNQGREQIRLGRVGVFTELGERAQADEFVLPTATGKIYYSPVQVDEVTGEPSMTIADPLLDARTGTSNGVLVAKVRFKKIWDLIAGIRVNEGQSVYLVDARNSVVAHRNPSVVLRGTQFSALAQDGIQPGLTGARSVLAVQRTVLGEQLLNTVVEQEWTAALALAINSVILIGTVIVFTLGIAAVLGFISVRQIVRPIQALATAAQQISTGDLTAQAPVTSHDEIGTLATTFNSMTVELRDLIGSLEERVQARTEQLRASADVGRAAASVLESDELLSSVVNLITDRFGFYYTAIFIVDDAGHYAVLREATGEAGRTLKERGHKLEVNGQSMVGYAITRRHARIALDVGTEAIHFANPLLPDTRSEIALPLSVGDRVLGALDVQSTQGAAFDEASAAVLQAMADQIAIALNNALSYAETQALARRSRALFAASREVGRLQTDLAETIRATLHAAADILNYDHWCVLTFNEIRTGLVAIAAHNWPGSEAVLDVQSQADHPLVYTVQQDIELFINEPYDLRLGQLQIADLRNLISVPIKTRETLVGVLAFSRTLDSELTEGDLEVGHSLANLIAIAIENYNLIETSQRTLRELDEVNRSLTGQSWEKFARRQGEHGLIWVSRNDQLQPQVLPEVSEALSLGRIATRVLEDRQQLGVAVPIKLRDVPVGALRLIVPQRTWNSEMATALDSIAGHIAQASENARLIAVTEERLTRERALAEATEKVRQRSEIEAILQTATTELARYLNASHITVHMAAETQPAAGNGEHVGR